MHLPHPIRRRRHQRAQQHAQLAAAARRARLDRHCGDTDRFELDRIRQEGTRHA
jgi:hypothetical protein